METWIDEHTGEITLPPGVRLDLAGVGKALGIGWAAQPLAGRHAGILVDVGGDLVALGRDESGESWRVSVNHGGVVGEFAGSPLAVATSTTMHRAWKADGESVHHLIDPRTGEPSRGRFAYATVAASTILEAELAAKLLILAALRRRTPGRGQGPRREHRVPHLSRSGCNPERRRRVTVTFLALFAFVLVSSAALISLLWVRKPVPAVWAVASLGALALALATASGTTMPLDLGTVLGVVILADILGAGWKPERRNLYLVVAYAGLLAGALARFIFFTAGLGGVAETPSGTLPWDLARSAGFVAFLAATGSVVFGARRPSRLPLRGLPARIYALHRALGVASLLALAVHLFALRFDAFIGFSWYELLIAPWTSSYRPLALTVGWRCCSLSRPLPAGASESSCPAGECYTCWPTSPSARASYTRSSPGATRVRP